MIGEIEVSDQDEVTVGEIDILSVTVQKGRRETEIVRGPNGPEIRIIDNGKEISVSIGEDGSWFSVIEAYKIIGFLQKAISIATEEKSVL